jgi:hypothetical protein
MSESDDFAELDDQEFAMIEDLDRLSLAPAGDRRCARRLLGNRMAGSVDPDSRELSAVGAKPRDRSE